jgi:hypothetical protein
MNKLNMDKLNMDKLNMDKLNMDKLNVDKWNMDKLNMDKLLYVVGVLNSSTEKHSGLHTQRWIQGRGARGAPHPSNYWLVCKYNSNYFWRYFCENALVHVLLALLRACRITSINIKVYIILLLFAWFFFRMNHNFILIVFFLPNFIFLSLNICTDHLK